MQHRSLDLRDSFSVLLENERAQAAEMVLAPGDSTGGPDNRHEGSDQWLFVVSGDGVAIVGGDEIRLTRHDLLLIERGEAHEIRNTGNVPLATVNLYVPPEY